MKKIIISFLILFILTFTACYNPNDNKPFTPSGKGNYVNIMEINDTHGAALTDDSNNGVDKVDSLKQSLEEHDGDYIFIVNGDAFQGGYVSNVTKGEVFIDCFNAMNIDCYVLGNHEFDWGLETIARFKDGDESNGEANFPFLCANLIDTTTGLRPDWVDEYVIVENNGWKVGIIGVIGADLESSIAESSLGNYEFIDSIDLVSSIATSLRTEEECDVVIVADHEYSTSINKEYASLSGNARIDAIICGHTHQSVEERLFRNDSYVIPIIQSYTKNGNVGTIRILMENVPKSSTMKHYTVADYPQASWASALEEKYLDQIVAGNQPIAYTSTYLSKEDIGILSCDAMCEKYGADVACVNQSGVRATITKGAVYEKNVLEVFPFEDYVYLVDITGSKLKQFYSIEEGYLYYNTSFDINKIDDNKTYKLAVIDFIYTYKSVNKVFKDLEYTNTMSLLSDIVLEYMKENIK